jgi:hypothetical protein
MGRFALHGTSPENVRHGLEPWGAPPRACGLALAVLVACAAPAVSAPPSAAQGSPDNGPPPEGGSSDRALAREGRLSISADDQGIRLGQRVRFTGRRQPGRRGDPIKLRYRPAGGDYRVVARATTDARGHYRVAATPRHNGSFVVSSPRSSGEALRSRREEVSVRAEIGIEAERHQLGARGIEAGGRVRPGTSGRRVTLERQTGKGWQRVDRTRTTSAGDYRFRWKPPGLGTYALRARFRGDDSNRGDRAALDHRVVVYRKDHASYYGPGFYGETTACGQTLRRDTVGVAHKRIRCGTVVRFRYHGTTRRIPVIDRGPFIRGRRWDLTDAARRKLGFPKGTDDIWADR